MTSYRCLLILFYHWGRGGNNTYPFTKRLNLRDPCLYPIWLLVPFSLLTFSTGPPQGRFLESKIFCQPGNVTRTLAKKLQNGQGFPCAVKVPGIKYRASHMLSMCCSTELHPRAKGIHKLVFVLQRVVSHILTVITWPLWAVSSSLLITGCSCPLPSHQDPQWTTAIRWVCIWLWAHWATQKSHSFLLPLPSDETESS